VGLLDAQGRVPRAARDLDLHLWKLMSQQFQVYRKLPFTLPHSYVPYVSLRGAACWSLHSNATSHEVVRDLYTRVPRASIYPLCISDG
jgi:hypothetical protein